MIFKRYKYLNQIYNWLEDHKIILLLGARQVGKTTLLKMILNDDRIDLPKYYVNFDEFYERKFVDKNEFIDFFSFTKWIDFYSSGLLLLDEIQNIENIEKILKSLYDDEKIKLKIIATWSGLWHFSQTFSTLVWRIKEIFVYPFSFYEFLEYKWIDISFLTPQRYKPFMFNRIKQYLIQYYIFWWYPAVVLQDTKEKKIEKLAEIIEIYLKRDLALFLKNDEIRIFKRLLIYLSNNISEKLNINSLASYLGVSRIKVERYIQILKNSFLLYDVYPFYKNKRREQSKQPEIFFIDNWFVNYLNNRFNFVDFDWKMIEHFVFLEVLKNKKFIYDEIKYYQKINGSEIDFIYEFKSGWIVPIEVKLTDKDNIPKIFSSFYKDYKDLIKFFVRTSKKQIFNRTLEDKEIKIIPFWMIGEVI